MEEGLCTRTVKAGMRVGKEAIVCCWLGGLYVVEGWAGLMRMRLRGPRSGGCLSSLPHLPELAEVIQPSEPVFPRLAIATSSELYRMTGSVGSVLG